MDISESRYKFWYSKYECSYCDCNYHVRSIGKYFFTKEDKIPVHMPRNEEETKYYTSNMDI